MSIVSTQPERSGTGTFVPNELLSGVRKIKNGKARWPTVWGNSSAIITCSLPVNLAIKH